MSRSTCTTRRTPSNVPLNALSDAELVPGAAALAAFNAKLA
jgi:hypothetical protein